MKCRALGEDRIGRSHSLGDFDRLIAHVLIVGGVRGSPAVMRDYYVLSTGFLLLLVLVVLLYSNLFRTPM
jgi:hypothetical protein